MALRVLGTPTCRCKYELAINLKTAALQAQLALLDHVIKGIYSLPEELALALATDSQGLGGTPI